METETCIECGDKLPLAYALTTCPKCSEVFARIRAYAEANGAAGPEYVKCAHGACNMVARREVGACKIHIEREPMQEKSDPDEADAAAIRDAYVKGKQAAAETFREGGGEKMVGLESWLPTPPQRPSVHHGEVLGVLYGELTQLIREHQALKAFEARVVDAAKSPAAWLALREELGK
jgi:hypothetical protein